GLLGIPTCIQGKHRKINKFFFANLFTVCLSIAFHALSYNSSSGSGDALAYDSLKISKMECEFERYESNQLIIYRVCSGLSTLCAGFALFIGHRIAYGTDLIMCAAQILVLSSLHEVYASERQSGQKSNIGAKLIGCFGESLAFLKQVGKAMGIMMCNSLVGAVDILLLFFMQAKLPEKGIPQWGLGFALLFMEMGGVVGSKLILKLPKLSYKQVYAVSAVLVLIGFLAEHSPLYPVMAIGGFIAAVGDDALQVRTNAILQDMFPSEQRATLTSVESFTFSLIMIALSPLAGFVFTYW
ncbi:MAG: MFS transporter, partial [Oscillospiraceae bacterium]|nr:MFS transporter [Oscillospiraceae bacterium]